MFAFAGKVFEIVAWQNKTPQKNSTITIFFSPSTLPYHGEKIQNLFGLLAWPANKHPFSS